MDGRSLRRHLRDQCKLNTRPHIQAQLTLLIPERGKLRITAQPGSVGKSLWYLQTLTILGLSSETCVYFDNINILQWEVPLWSYCFISYCVAQVAVSTSSTQTRFVPLYFSSFTKISKRTKYRVKICTKYTILTQISLRFKHYDDPLSSRLLGLWES
jgi:hypothetical protein